MVRVCFLFSSLLTFWQIHTKSPNEKNWKKRKKNQIQTLHFLSKLTLLLSLSSFINGVPETPHYSLAAASNFSSNKPHLKALWTLFYRIKELQVHC